MKEDSIEAFRQAPIPVLVWKNTVPAIAAMILVMVYNLADTFFIGKTGNPYMVAAVSLAMPVYLLFMAVGNIFGAGGTSMISRSFGKGNWREAAEISAFCFWGCLAVSLLMTAGLLAFMDPLLYTMGASDDTFAYARIYLVIVTVSGPLVTFSNCFGSIIRTEGRAVKAMMGMLLGNLLNVALDPFFILVLDWGTAGAAAATAVSNGVSAIYYALYLSREDTRLSIHYRSLALRQETVQGVLSIGIPAALGDMLMSFSQIIANGQLAAYGDLAVAGYGVASKITMMTGMMSIGFGQGIQPVLGYCTGSGDRKRFRSVLRFSLISSSCLSLGMTLVCWIFTGELVHQFLSDKDAYSYAFRFARILLTTGFLFGIFYVLTSTLQAMGKGTEALIANVSRQGLIFIPALFLFSNRLGMDGILWAQPVADLLSLLLVAYLCWEAIQRKGYERNTI